MLTLRSIRRMIVVIATAFAAICASATAPEDMVLANRCANAAQLLLSMKCTLATVCDRTVVSDLVYCECKSVYLMMKRRSPGFAARPPAAVQRRRYPTRKTITVPMAAAITGLSESTIKRLDRDPKNTNYPGRNATAKILAAWAKMYRGDRLAAREVRAANRPSLGYGRS